MRHLLLGLRLELFVQGPQKLHVGSVAFLTDRFVKHKCPIDYCRPFGYYHIFQVSNILVVRFHEDPSPVGVGEEKLYVVAQFTYD